MQKITGVEPPKTCPWQAMYHPFVREVISLFWALDGGNLAILGADPDAALVDGLGAFNAAFQATLNEERRLADQDAEIARRSAASKAGM